MSQASEQISRQFANGATNRVVWGDLIYNVKVYGAKGNGETDDAAAIQQAIDAAVGSGGGTVLFPPGSYYHGSTLNVNSNAVVLEGVGASILITDKNITSVQIGTYDYATNGAFSSSYYRYFNQVNNLIFQNSYNGGSRATIAIDMRAAAYARIENNRFEGHVTGIRVKSMTQHCIFTRNSFGNYGAATMTSCIHVDSSGADQDYNATGNVYSTNSFLGATNGIYFTGDTFGDCIISNNQFISVTNGVKAVSSGSMFYATKIGIYNSDFDGAVQYPVYLDGCLHVNISGANMAQDASVGTGVYLKDCRYCNVSDLKITHGNIGVKIQGGSENTVANIQTQSDLLTNALILDNTDNNHISDCDLKSSGTTVTITAGSTGNRLINNKLAASSGTTISTYTGDDSNRFIDDLNNNYVSVFSGQMAGEFVNVTKVLAVTSTTTYTNLIRISLPVFSGCYVRLMYSLVLGGAGTSLRTEDFILKRDAGAVSIIVIANTTNGPVFDIQADTTTQQGSLILGIKRNTGAGGTQLDGTLVTKVLGAATSLITNM